MGQVGNGVRHRRRGLALATLTLVAACASSGPRRGHAALRWSRQHADGTVRRAFDRGVDRGADDGRDHARDHTRPDDDGASAQP